MVKRSFLKVGDIIPQLVAKSKVYDSLKAVWVLHFWPDVKNKVFDNLQVPAGLKPVAFKNNTLIIQAPTPLWLSELRLKSRLIQTEFNKKLGKNLVSKVVFRLSRGYD